ncbi:hypothetical protein JG687_00016881 [Phytophthora cactorum]|uniref:Zinc finger, CCHC-type n=1 Tax=Phytophthora cactorum TaxID=29920 RepID=A0A8T1TRW3_9STRA|nr:hypothetical protein JG687_00016881 [Phytophthora cactorum]
MDGACGADVNRLVCRRETCRYNSMTCNNIRQCGHVAFECPAPRQQNNGYKNHDQRSNGGGTGLRQKANGGQRLGSRTKCFFCCQTDHCVAECPSKKAVLLLAGQSAAGTVLAKEPTPAQH